MIGTERYAVQYAHSTLASERKLSSRVADVCFINVTTVKGAPTCYSTSMKTAHQPHTTSTPREPR